MRVRIWRRGCSDPVEIDETSLVLVSLDDGAPISVSWQQVARDGSAGLLTAHVAENDFVAVLRGLGIPVTRLPPPVLAK